MPAAAQLATLPLRDALVASTALTLTPEQIRFLRLHANHLVISWRWHWGSTLLRATAEGGLVASLGVDEFDALLRAGLVKRRASGTVTVTDAGRRAAE